MNLFILDSIDVSTFGGYQNWIGLIAPALSKLGHNVTVAGRPKSEFLKRFSKVSENINIFEIEISGDFNPWTISKLRKQFQKENTDIVICDFNKDVRLGGLAARLQKDIKVVWRLGLNLTKNSFIHRFLTPKLIDTVVVPSEELKRQVVASGYIDENIVRVIPHGIPNIDFELSKEDANKKLKEKYSIDKNNFIAVTSGRFVEQKGHKYLIEAACDIVKVHNNISFLFLGDGPLQEKLQKQISELNLEDHFVFAGMLSDFNLELAGSDLMIHPSVDEPFGFSVLEGMRAGLPVIASRIGGIPEFAIDNKTALLIEPCNSKLLSNSVIDMLNSPEKMLAFGLAGKERWQSDFKLEVMVDCWEKYLNHLISFGY